MSKVSRLAVLSFLACTLAATGACKKDGSSSRSKSPRAKWVDSPQRGQTNGAVTRIEGLDVQFETPDVLYVYRSCAEAGHSAGGSEANWIPVISCEAKEPSGGGDVDEFGVSESDDDEFSSPLLLTIYAAPKDMVINERAVETFRAKYQNAGLRVDEIVYHENYLNKPGRRGIYSRIQIIDPDTGYPSDEIQRFIFPKGDVIFIAQVEYPSGTDRSGIVGDWERILWNFEFLEEIEPEAEAE